MSVHAQDQPLGSCSAGIPDAMESFLLALVEFAIKHLPHNVPQEKVASLLSDYSCDGWRPSSSSFMRRVAICDGMINVASYTGGKWRNGAEVRRPFEVEDLFAFGSVAHQRGNVRRLDLAELLEHVVLGLQQSRYAFTVPAEDFRCRGFCPGVCGQVDALGNGLVRSYLDQHGKGEGSCWI